jgi:RHS repeat-associated protein
MRIDARRLVLCLTLFCLGIACWAAGVSQAFPDVSASSLGGGLVVAGVQALDEGQQLRAQRAAVLASPVAVAAREASRTRFSGLGTEQAVRLAREVFSSEVEGLSGGLGALPGVAKVTGFPSDRAASVVLADGARGVVESLEPIAVEDGGRRVPVNLGLSEAAGVFGPVSPLVAVRIPRRVGAGVQLARTGVSLVPVDASGVPAGGSEGVSDGASVVYANTQTDTDIVVKPTTFGFEADALLRSVRSPQRVAYRVVMPRGGRLVQDPVTGAVRVLVGGATVASVLAPSAVDAVGTPVSVSMRVAGDILSVAVDDQPGGLEFPIDVDPEVVDESLGLAGSGKTSNWVFKTSNASGWSEEVASSQLAILSKASWVSGENAILTYSTRGDSRIYYFEGDVSGPGTYASEESLHIVNSAKKVEAGAEKLLNSNKIAYSGWFAVAGACTAGSCQKQSEKGSAENTAQYGVWTTGSSGGGSTSKMSAAKVYIAQEVSPEMSVSTASEVAGKPNVLFGSGSWLGPHSGSGFEVKGHDPGIGLSHYSIETYDTGGEWSESRNLKEENGGSRCAGVQCEPNFAAIYGYVSTMPNGEYNLVGNVNNETGLKGEISVASGVKLKIDNAPPHAISIAGLGASDEIGEGEYTLTAYATDGEGTTKSSGIRGLQVAVDGREIGTSAGSCSPGPCTAKASWEINGAEFGAGEHKLTVTATDQAKNVEHETFTFKVHHSTPISVGPGSVSPGSGELGMSATDVSIPVPGGTLAVSRSYRSRHLTAGAEGPLGPQWALSVSGQESILVAPNENAATLTAATGGQTTFTATGGGKFSSPEGDANLALSEVENEKAEKELLLKDAANGATTRFMSTGLVNGGYLWKPVKQEGPVSSQTARFVYETVEGISRPVEALAPEPPGVSCGKEIKELKAGCRALGFVYATEKTATGEKPSEWGSYKNRLKEVLYYAYNITLKEVKPISVAEYRYDAQGRLRAEWNPQISPKLETTYGYDAEGHVTSLNPSGQEPWLLHYGTGVGDANLGRLLSVIRPAATSTTELAAAEAQAPPGYTAGPTLSSKEPKVGVKISVSSNGTWSNSPLAYSYQWEDCDQSGEGTGCEPIPGAVNQSYYPVSGDQGHDLVAEVSAVNANGSVAASSTATGLVKAGTQSSPAPEPPAVGSSSVWTLEYQVPLSGNSELPTLSISEDARWGQSDNPAEGSATAIFPPDTPMGWPADAYKRATVEYLDKSGHTVNVYTPTGGLSTTEYNKYGDVTRTLSADNRAAAIKETCEPNSCKSSALAKLLSTEDTYEETGSEPGTQLLSTLGPQHPVELTDGSEVEAREHTVYSYNENEPKTGGPYDLVTKTTQGAVVAGVEEPESVRTTVTSYTGPGSQENLGWKLRKPISVTTDPTSALNPNGLNLVHTTEYEANTGEPVEAKLPAAAGKDRKVPPTYAASFGTKGTGAGQLEKPTYDAIGAKGNVWVTEYGSNRISEFSPTGAFIETLGWGVSNGEHKLEACKSSCEEGLQGTEKGELYDPTGIAIANGLIYVVDSGNDRIEVYNEEKNEAVNQWGEAGTTAGKFKTPLAIAISPSSGNVWVGDSLNHRLQEFKAEGKFVEAVGWGVINNEKKEYEVCTSPTGCEAGLKGEGEGEFASTWGMTFAGSTLYVTDTGNNRVEMINEKSEPAGHFGAAGTGNGQLEAPVGIATNPVTGNLYVTDTGNNRMQVFTPSGEYLTQFASFGTGNGQLDFPEGDAINSTGEIYVVDDLNHRVERWVPTITGNEEAHDTKTVYYTAKEEAAAPECRNHPEWAELPCQTEPVAQPGGSLPQLPITTITSYNIWDESLTTVEKGVKTRTKTDTYDSAGRLKAATVESGEGTALPEVTYSYTAESGAETGAVTKQSTPSTGKTITSVYNTLGQLTSYTDADGNTASYEYDEDGRIHKTNDGKGTQTYTYNKTTGLPEELIDSSHEGMKFTASYDLEGNMVTEGYPNGMTAYYTYNQTGAPTSLVYKKLTNCTEEEKEKCQWYKDNVVPSIHGQWLTQTSNLSKQEYVYDAAGRLTQVENTPAGKGCTTRIYAYDEDSNRVSLTTREPNLKKECTTTGGTTEHHTYDTADRLTDNSIAYNDFGDITTLPETDTEGGPLTNTYYADGQAASQTQHEQTIGYDLDPAGRTRETIATGKKTSDIVSHYPGPGNEPSWTTNTSGETTRNIPAINGQLAAIQNNSEAPVIQLANLHGDLIGTAYLSETATELASKADTSEFGVPTTTLPAKYSWLGTIELPTELPSGVTTMGVRSYVPQIGRFLQPDPIPGGSSNAYAYTFQDPVNSKDPSGEYTFVAGYVNEFDEQWSAGAEGREATRTAERRAAEEAAARAAAEYAAQQAAWAAEQAAGPQYAEEWEEWWEEEGEYEYASDHHGSTGSNEEAHVEPAILVQPLVSQTHVGEGEQAEVGAVPLCEGGATGACSRDAGGIGHSHGKKLMRALNHDYPEKGISGCTKGLIAYGALGTVTDILDPPKALAACAIGEVLG